MTSAPVTVRVSVGKSIDDKHPLYFLRTERGWSVDDLAEMAQVSHGAILNWERGTHPPRLREAFRLAVALETTVDRLFSIPYKREAREVCR